jgi:hypothetical protein
LGQFKQNHADTITTRRPMVEPGKVSSYRQLRTDHCQQGNRVEGIHTLIAMLTVESNDHKTAR